MGTISKRYAVVAILVVLAALDYAALDDITTGRQPNFIAEWVMLGLSLPIAWLAIRWGLRPSRSGP